MRAPWILFLALVLVAPTILATSPSSPLELTLRVAGVPAMNERFSVSLDITAHMAIGNVTIDLYIPPDWEKRPPGNRTLALDGKEAHSLTWHVTPKSEGFWTVRAYVAAYEGGMTSRTQNYGFLHANESRISSNPDDVIPTPAVELQFRAVEQTPAHVTLIATATPRASWMRFGTLSTEFGILNESKSAEGPGHRALIASLTTYVPPHYGARGWSQFGFTPDWRTETPPETGRAGTGLGCRDLWATREAAANLTIEPSRPCDEVRSHLSPGPGIGAIAILGVAALWIQRRRPE